MKQKINKIFNIVVIDDSKDALQNYAKIFNGSQHDLKMFCRPSIDQNTKKILINYKPNLFIIDLLMGKGHEDGYDTIRELQEIEPLKEVPIIIVSKFISNTIKGGKIKEECENLPGVVNVYSKYPHYPSLQDIIMNINIDKNK